MSCAIITGASGGIGWAMAKCMRAELGIDKFWLIARNTEKMEKLSSELDGAECKIISADLTRSEGIELYRKALSEERPEVDFLFNGAGFGVFGAFDELAESTVTDMIDLNIKATVLITHMTVPFMKRGGRIIQMGSGSCFTPLPYFNIYSSSKVFVLHYTKSLNYELKPYGIRATCFCPGWVDTAFLARSKDVPNTRVPKAMKPLLNADKIVRGCLRASLRGKSMYVTNWFTKMQHMLFKLCPDKLLTKMWLGMLTDEPKKTDKES